MHEEPRDTEDLKAVLGWILDHNRSRWLQFALAVLKNEADAEDVLQEAVCRVLAHNAIARNGQPLPREQVRMYLGRAIGNTALELYNSRKRERMRQIPVKEDLLISSNTLNPYACMEEGERAAEKEHMLQLLNEGLGLLPLKQREALRITILESRGLSIRDVGMAYGIPYSTLRHRTKKGLQHLRRFLKLKRRCYRSQEAGVRRQESGARS